MTTTNRLSFEWTCILGTHVERTRNGKHKNLKPWLFSFERRYRQGSGSSSAGTANTYFGEAKHMNLCCVHTVLCRDQGVWQQQCWDRQQWPSQPLWQRQPSQPTPPLVPLLRQQQLLPLSTANSPRTKATCSPTWHRTVFPWCSMLLLPSWRGFSLVVVCRALPLLYVHRWPWGLMLVSWQCWWSWREVGGGRRVGGWG